MRPYYGLFYDGNGRDVRPELISKHWTLAGAERAYRRRNWWIFQRDRARRAGLSNCSTFDAVYYVNEEGNIDKSRDYAIDFGCDF